MNRIFRNFCTICFTALLIPSFSQDPTIAREPVTVKPLIGAALEFGGESVAEVLFTNGDSQDMPAGQGGSLFGGLETSFAGLNNFTIRSTIGIKYLTTAADNVHIRLTRIPIHITANLLLPKDFRLSAGIATHRSIRLNTGGLGQNITFNPATAPVFEVAWKWVGLSVVPMNYKTSNGERFNATAIGLTFSGAFGPKK